MDNVSQAIVIGGYTEDSPLEMSYIGITDITGWWNEDSGEITATGTVRISPIRDVCHILSGITHDDFDECDLYDDEDLLFEYAELVDDYATRPSGLKVIHDDSSVTLEKAEWQFESTVEASEDNISTDSVMKPIDTFAGSLKIMAPTEAARYVVREVVARNPQWLLSDY